MYHKKLRRAACWPGAPGKLLACMSQTWHSGFRAEDCMTCLHDSTMLLKLLYCNRNSCICSPSPCPARGRPAAFRQPHAILCAARTQATLLY